MRLRRLLYRLGHRLLHLGRQRGLLSAIRTLVLRRRHIASALRAYPAEHKVTFTLYELQKTALHETDVTKVLVALEFLHRCTHSPARIAVFPGAWNPPTVAHAEIARAASRWADEILWVIPRAFPHKTFEGATLEARCAMLTDLAKSHAHSAATSEGGLYGDIADEARAHFGPHTEIALVCGRDAAERLASWTYPDPDYLHRMMSRYRLLVAARLGDYLPPERYRDRIVTLEMASSFDLISSTEVRRRIAEHGAWEPLVPESIHQHVRAAYR